MKTRLLLGTVLLACASTMAQSTAPQPLTAATRAKIAAMRPLFDGQTLDGWIQMPPAPLTVSGGDVRELPALVRSILAKAEPFAAFLAAELDEPAAAALAAVPVLAAPPAGMYAAHSAAEA